MRWAGTTWVLVADISQEEAVLEQFGTQTASTKLELRGAERSGGNQLKQMSARVEPGRQVSGAAIVEAYLDASMRPDPDMAATFMAPGAIIVFTGGRTFAHPREATAFNAGRYRWVKKQMDRFDVCETATETIVYSIGTLYGEWPNGEPFSGNRYVDRFVVVDGKIVAVDVWNDSAERILVQQGASP